MITVVSICDFGRRDRGVIERVWEGRTEGIHKGGYGERKRGITVVMSIQCLPAIELVDLVYRFWFKRMCTNRKRGKYEDI